MPAPAAFYVAGLSDRSIVAVGEIGSMPPDQAPFVHDRIPAGVVGTGHQLEARPPRHLVPAGGRWRGLLERRRPVSTMVEPGPPNASHGWTAPT